MDNKKIGLYIKELMKMNNMTNRDLINELQKKHITMSEANMSKFLNGKQGTDIENYIAIANIFNISIDDIFNDRKEVIRKVLNKNTKIKLLLSGFIIGIIVSIIIFYLTGVFKEEEVLESSISEPITLNCNFDYNDGIPPTELDCFDFNLLIESESKYIRFYLNNIDEHEVIDLEFYIDDEKFKVYKISDVEFKTFVTDGMWYYLYEDARLVINYIEND